MEKQCVMAGGVVLLDSMLLSYNFFLEKKMKKITVLFCLVVSVVFVSAFLSGCGTKKVVEHEAVKTTEGLGVAESLDKTVEEVFAVREGRTSGPMVPIYFAFDKSLIEGDQVSRIEKNAMFLKQESGLLVRVEGNTDSRGTNEYNLALGERRALSAVKYLVNLGVDGDRLATISWGEEKPLLFGHDELSWAQNRRADFVVIQ